MLRISTIMKSPTMRKTGKINTGKTICKTGKTSGLTYYEDWEYDYDYTMNYYDYYDYDYGYVEWDYGYDYGYAMEDWDYYGYGETYYYMEGQADGP
jgi:hypothetical protein